jgi:phenylacetate-CoA ligase
MGMNQKNPYSLRQALKLREQSCECIEKEQLLLFKKHLRQAACVPFYKKIFERKGLDVSTFRELQDISQIPFTTRLDIDQYPLQFGLRDKKKIRDIAITSGTTGEPVIVPYTAGDLHRLAFNEAVAFYGAGVEVGDRVLLTVTLDRCFIAGLAYYSGATSLGASAIRSGPGQPARQWHIIEKLNPRIIVGVPSFLKELGEWGIENGINVAECSLETIVTIGEPVRKPDYSPTALGKYIEELWGAKMFSSYGATEFETAFCECGESAGGHVHPELMLVEIIDDYGKVLPDGKPGEVVVTPLGVEGFPLVRFRTGDIARLDNSPCRCGWNTKRLGPIEGRLAQRLKYKGTTLYPETIFHALQEILNIRGAYVEVRSTADGTDDITVVVGCDDSAVDVKKIEENLQAHLRVRPTVELKKSEDVSAKMTKENGRKLVKFFDYRTG